MSHSQHANLHDPFNTTCTGMSRTPTLQVFRCSLGLTLAMQATSQSDQSFCVSITYYIIVKYTITLPPR